MEYKYLIPEQVSTNQILSDLKKKYIVQHERSSTSIRRYYDTFDWRLFNQTYEFYSEGNQYYLSSIGNLEPAIAISLNRRPKFIQDIPDPVVRKVLKLLVQMRALMQIFSTSITRVNVNILNRNQKIVSRIEFSEFLWKKKSVFSQVIVKSLRGYNREVLRLCEWLEKNEFQKSEKTLFCKVGESFGRLPGAYSSKFSVSLDPEMDVTIAVEEIHKFLLKVMQENEFGIIKDIDTEFLHDFRVAIRRTRSLYGQVKRSIDADTISRAKMDYTYLGKLTNRMRDIDVYLLNKEKYLKYLPKNMQKDMSQFFEDLENERIIEHKKLVNNIKSTKYRNIKRFWDTYLNRTHESQVSGESIRSFAKNSIIKKFKKILLLGGRIRPDSPDSLLHELRIECKKLRYLLEFFLSLFPKGIIPVLIRQLKILQDNLGDYNDLCVQQKTLHEYVDQLALYKSKDKQLLLAIGFLIGKLNLQQTVIREQFTKTYREFSGSKTQKIFNNIKVVS